MPKISLKNPQEIAIMTEGGEKLGRIMDEVLAKVKPGLSTLEIDTWIENRIKTTGGEPAFKKVPRYHWASCTGINDEVVHSIPQKNKIIQKGDLLKIDIGLLWRGLNTDMSWTIPVGEVNSEESRFLKAGEKALSKAVETCRPGNRVGHISQAIEKAIVGADYRPVEILTGHGIGKKLHEEPLIPGLLKGKVENTPELLPGMTLALEVIYNQGEGKVVLGNDGWTILTKDGKISGLFEKTIAITENGPLILTPLRFNQKGD